MNIAQPYNQQYIQPQQEYEEEPEEQYSQINPYARAIYPNQDQGFLKWLLDYRKQTVEPLRHVWRGEEYDFERHIWFKNSNHPPIMNEKGISWGISLIESYCSPVFLATEMDEKTYNQYMREVIRDIINGLTTRYEEFGIKSTTDIKRIHNEIETKIGAVLRGALNDGYRDFFSTTQNSTEIKNLTPPEAQRRPGVFASMANMFRRQQGQVYQ